MFAEPSAARTMSSVVASAENVGVHSGDFDLVRIAAERVAVAAKDVDLVRYLFGAAEDVAGVGVLSDEAQGLPLAAPTDHDPRARRADGHRTTDRLLELIVPTEVGAVVVAPHLKADLDCLFESLETLGRGRERHPEAAVLTFVPRRADSQVRRAHPTRRRAW